MVETGCHRTSKYEQTILCSEFSGKNSYLLPRRDSLVRGQQQGAARAGQMTPDGRWQAAGVIGAAELPVLLRLTLTPC